MAKKRNWLGIAALLVLLVVFPVMSYIYMKAGFDYQVDARKELQDLGEVPRFPTETIFGDTLTGKDQGKQVRLLAFFDPAEAEELAISGKYFSEIYEQFDEMDWFRMEFMVPEQSKRSLQDYLAEKGMEESAKIFFYGTTQSREPVNQQLHIADDLRARLNVVALADTTGTVRQYYDLSNGKQFVRLIEHIAMMRPPEKDERQEALFQREREL